MTNFEDFIRTGDEMNKVEEPTLEIQKTVYLGLIAKYLSKIADSLAVIADKLTEESEEDTDQKSLEEWTAGEENRWESEEK